MPDLNNIFSGGIGGLSTFATILLIFFIVIVVLGLVVGLIFLIINNRKYKHIIPLYKKIGNNVMRVAVFKARDYKIGTVGDKLWYVRKVKKYLPPATIQSAPHEYTHFEREDGEWINIGIEDIDSKLKKLNVKYIHQDMRANRIAIGEILEQRFKNKEGFWEKYGQKILTIILFLVCVVSMVIIFYQFSTIVDKIGGLLDRVIALEDQRKAGQQGIVPVIALLLVGGIKRKWISSKH